MGIGFDTAFVFTEVNADVVVYVKDPASSWGFRKSDNFDHIGGCDGDVCGGEDNQDADVKDLARLLHVLLSNLQLQFIAIPIRVDRNTTHIGKLLVTKAIGKSTHDPQVRVRTKYFRNYILFFKFVSGLGRRDCSV